jgi:hypothetical protein
MSIIVWSSETSGRTHGRKNSYLSLCGKRMRLSDDYAVIDSSNVGAKWICELCAAAYLRTEK